MQKTKTIRLEIAFGKTKSEIQHFLDCNKKSSFFGMQEVEKTSEFLKWCVPDKKLKKHTNF